MFNFTFKVILGFVLVLFYIENRHVNARELRSSVADQTRWLFEGRDCINSSIHNYKAEFFVIRHRLFARGTRQNLTYSRKGIFGARGLYFPENPYFEIPNRKISHTGTFVPANRGTIIKGNFDKHPVGCATFISAQTNSRTKDLFKLDRTFIAENQKRRQEEIARKKAETERLLTIAITDFVKAYKFLLSAEQEVKKGKELSEAAKELAAGISRRDYLK